MATLTRLASTLTAKYFPSQTLTDAFYIDGRLFGKREARQADITIDKEERGFFFSVFAHPTIPEYEIGTLPPYEPLLRGTCNDVKFGRKEIDGMIEGFLSTAVDITGKMRLQDGDDRAPYFSGVIVRDAEAFAVTIGSGLAFLYRDDTLFPLTDAGIPMEPIDSNGNRVGDFMYYCSSKTANALWSNFFTLSPDDCIILCNKEIYDALGQREMLRILAEAEDQCDAAGVIITQASARMPNVPMQFSISFVESVTNEDKKGLFGFRKKNKEEDQSDMSIESTTEGGVVGAASAAIADAGFTSGLKTAEAGAAAAAAGAAIMFGDKSPSPVAPAENQVASADKGIELESTKGDKKDSPLEFLDTSVAEEPAVEVSAEEMMKNLFAETAKKEPEAPSEPVVEESPFVSGGFNPFDAAPVAETADQVVSETPVILEEDDNSKTKPIEKLDADFFKSFENTQKNSTIKSEDIIEAALKELKEGNEVKSEVEENNTTPAAGSDEIVFSQGSEEIKFDIGDSDNKASATFDPYSVGDSTEMQNAVPLVFGDDETSAPTPVAEEKDDKDPVSEIPVPDFEIPSEKPELQEKDKLSVDFPEITKEEPEVKEEKAEEQAAEDKFELPFENHVDTFSDEPKETEKASDIPDMPMFDANTFDTPVNAVSSEEPINTVDNDVYSYGQYVENENMAAPEPMAQQQYTEPEPAPYQSFGNEGQQYESYDNGYQYQPGQYQAYEDPNAAYAQDQYAQPEQQTQSSADNDWINAILGIDENESYASDMQPESSAAAPAPGAAVGGATSAAPTMARTAPSAQSRPQPGTRPGGSGPAKRPATASSGAGGGGRGPVRKFPKLNRNGYMFLAFVVICLILFIVLISAIVKSCGKEPAGKETEPSDVEVTTESVEETTTAPAETTAADPSAPIAYFEFSDSIGFRTWWDVFNQVYCTMDPSVSLPENESDPRIATIIQYNGLDASYVPSSGDQILLPPLGVIDGSIPITWHPAGSNADEAPAETTAEETAADETVADNGGADA